MKLDFLWSKGFILKNSYCLNDTNYISKEEEIKQHIMWSLKNTPGIIWIRTTDSKNKEIETDLDFFAKNINLITENTILITGDGDRDVPSSYKKITINTILNNTFIKSWYTQNYDLTNKHSKFNFYPIGLNLHHKQIQMKMDPSKIVEELVLIKKPESKIMRIFCDTHLNITHPERTKMWNIIKDNKVIDFLDRRVNFNEIHRFYTDYQFVLSPRGNGVDCYRTWEALLFGSIVITKTSALDDMYIKNNLPVVILQEWDELNFEDIEDKLQKWKLKYNESTKLHNILSKFFYTYWVNIAS